MSARLRTISFGCRLNSYEAEVMRRQAEAAGLAEAVIVNTCAVTAEAVRQARQAIRRARREHPDSPIIVTGCAAQVDPGQFAAMPEVDRVLGNAEKLERAHYAPDFGLAGAERVRVNDIMAVRETAGHLIEGFEGRARAFVQVQNGCDHRCTFCIIPFGRGPSRSVPAGAVVDQVRQLVEGGWREVVLTGVDLTAYGADLPGRPSLGRLVGQILAQVPDLPRLRLSSLDSVEIDEGLFRLIAEEERVMPHLHLSLQAGDDLILKRMKRRHRRAEAVALCARLRAARPDIAFGADLIAGFPTESAEMFARSLDLIAECDLVHLHVFPFSPRPGTPAARMPHLPKPLIRERAAHLRAAGAARRNAWLATQIGREVRVLVERAGDGRCEGHSENFAPVRLATASGLAPDHAPGDLVAARITGVAEGMLSAQPIEMRQP